MRLLIPILLLTLTALSAQSQNSNKDALERNIKSINTRMDSAGEYMEKASVHLNDYKTQMNTGQFCTIIGSLVTTLALTASEDPVRFVWGGVGAGTALYGGISILTAEHHLKKMRYDMKQGSVTLQYNIDLN